MKNNPNTSANNTNFIVPAILFSTLILILFTFLYHKWTVADTERFDRQLFETENTMSTAINKLESAIKERYDSSIHIATEELVLEAAAGIKTCGDALQQVTTMQINNPTAFQNQKAIFSGGAYQEPRSLKSVLIAKLSDVLTIHKGLIKTFDENFTQQPLYQKIIDAEKQLSSVDESLKSMQSAFNVIKTNHTELVHILKTI